MSRVCILTDSTAQFRSPDYPGHELVTVLPLHIMLQGKTYTDNKDIKIGKLPPSARDGLNPKVLPPSADELRYIMAGLGQSHKEIVAVFLSGYLNPTVNIAQEAALTGYTPAVVHVIDSQTTAAGLGFLVQTAAEAAARGASGTEIKQLLHSLLPHIYTIFCMQSLTYLAHSTNLDLGQAILGEMLGVIPILVLENGKLLPVQKARTSRHMVDIFYEFLSEFGKLRHLALVQGMPPYTHEVRILRERITAEFPETPLCEHNLGAALGVILGPRSLGLVVIEK